MLRKPHFWIAFVALSVLGTFFAYRGFPSAFPLVSLDLKMDRAAAVAAAVDLAKAEGWAPSSHRTATQFHLDKKVQAFVELEAGGNEAFARMLKDGLYSPYVWDVRLFQEREVNEALVQFTPEGRLYGFEERVAEKAAGASLSSDEARGIAKGGAERIFRIDLDAYRAIETSHETRPAGRVDHTFTYERSEERIGEGRYRLRLVVTGDRLTELTHFVQIPEAFERRYEKMRSANNAVASVASFFALSLFVGGGVVALFLLLRQRWLLWKPSALVGGIVGLAIFVAMLSRWPLLWMEYDTAIPASTFAVQQVVQTAVMALGYGLFTAFMLMAAEGLTRRAFPGQIQLFRLWQGDVASSRAVWGRTLASYLVIGIMLAYFVVLYTFARRHLGWWTPSDALYDPDALASYFPWLFAITISMIASITEETVFRAVPLASAVLLGRRFGGTRYWVGVAVVLQALVFGAIHANYPAQPAYARLVEIALPFTLMGLVYLRFGLLPCLITHFAFDVVFFSMPLFASSAPGVLLGRILVVALTFVPLWFVLLPTLRRRRMTDAPAEALNGAWTPPPPVAAAPDEGLAPSQRSVGKRTRVLLLAAGAAGLVVVAVGLASRTSEAPPLPSTRETATAAARAALAARGVTLAPPWRELTTVQATPSGRDRFVWTTSGRDVYRSLLARYLPTPRWAIRYARFEGDLAERAEEYHVFVDGLGHVLKIEHTLPEQRAGRSLTKEEAESLALQKLSEAYGLSPESLVPVSAEPSERPARRDWTFVYSDPGVPRIGGGEARMTIGVAGDEVTGYGRFIHVPEEWERQDRQRETGAQVAGTAVTMAFILSLLAGCVVAAIGWSRGRFDARAFVQSAAVLTTLALLDLWNRWPSAIAGLSSAQPFALQAGRLVLFGILWAVVLATLVGLNLGSLHRSIRRVPQSLGGLILPGVALGLVFAALGVWLSSVGTGSGPTWASFASAGTRFPLLASALDPLGGWIRRTVFLFLVLVAIDRWSRGFSRKRVAAAALAFAVGFVLAGHAGIFSVTSWLVAGTLCGAVLLLSYVLVLRFQMALLPVATAVAAGVGALGQGFFRAHPGALAGSLLALLLLAIGSLLWLRSLTKDTAPPPQPPVSA